LTPIWDAISSEDGEIDEAKQKLFDNLLSLDGSRFTNTVYKDSINEIISQLSTDEEIQKQIRMILQFTYEDKDGNEIWNVDDQSDRLYKRFGIDKQSKASKSYLAVKDIE
jgi:hypothetical protein